MTISRVLATIGLLTCSSFTQGVQAQDALSAWSGVSKALRDCVAVAATRSNVTLEGIIANGVLPNDPRLSEIMLSCKQFVEGLKNNYQCNLKLTDGAAVSTVCNQYFGFRENGAFKKVTKDQAFRDAFTTRAQNYVVFEEEAPEGRAQREAMIKQALAPPDNPTAEAKKSASSPQPPIETPSEAKEQSRPAETRSPSVPSEG